MSFWKKKPAVMLPAGWLKVCHADAALFVQLFGRRDPTFRNTIRGTLQPFLRHGAEGGIYLQMIDVFLLDTSTAL